MSKWLHLNQPSSAAKVAKAGQVIFIPEQKIPTRNTPTKLRAPQKSAAAFSFREFFLIADSGSVLKMKCSIVIICICLFHNFDAKHFCCKGSLSVYCEQPRKQLKTHPLQIPPSRGLQLHMHLPLHRPYQLGEGAKEEQWKILPHSYLPASATFPRQVANFMAASHKISPAVCHY